MLSAKFQAGCFIHASHGSDLRQILCSRTIHVVGLPPRDLSGEAFADGSIGGMR